MVNNMSILNYIVIILMTLYTTIIFTYIILYTDRESKEPVYVIGLCLLSCIFTICLSLILGDVLLPKFDVVSSGLFSSYTYSTLRILLLALVEEYSKLIVLYLFISKNSSFDDIYDGVVYSALIALSFAAFESVLYVLNEPNFTSMKTLALVRGLTSVPLHLICGIVMGYFVGREKFSWGTSRRVVLLISSLLVPAFIHFVYNFSLSNIISMFNNSSYLIIILIIFIIPFYIVGYMAIKKAKKLNEKFISNENYKNIMTKNEYNEIINSQIKVKR